MKENGKIILSILPLQCVLKGKACASTVFQRESAGFPQYFLLKKLISYLKNYFKPIICCLKTVFCSFNY